MKTITKTISTICCSAILAVSTFATEELPTIKPQQVASMSPVRYVSFSPDNSKLVVSYGISEKETLKVVNLLSSTDIEHCSISDTGSYSDSYKNGLFSPNSQYIAVIRENNRLNILDSNCNETSYDKPYTTSNGFSSANVHWKSDSNTVLFSGGHYSYGDSILQFHLDTNTTSSKSLGASDLSASFISYSPNSELMAWTNDYDVFIHNVDSANKQLELEESSIKHETVEFIDNRTIVYKHSPSTDDSSDTVTIRDIDTGILDSFTSFDSSSTDLNIRYIKNSSYILVNIVDTNQYQLYDMRSKSYVAKVDFGDINAGGSYDMEVSQDGSKLAIIDSSDNLKVFDISAISSAENFKVAPVVSNINSTLKNRDTLNITFDVASE